MLFDRNREAYLFEEDRIISMEQGLPLLYFKDGMKNYS